VVSGTRIIANRRHSIEFQPFDDSDGESSSGYLGLMSEESFFNGDLGYDPEIALCDFDSLGGPLDKAIAATTSTTASSTSIYKRQRRPSINFCMADNILGANSASLMEKSESHHHFYSQSQSRYLLPPLPLLPLDEQKEALIMANEHEPFFYDLLREPFMDAKAEINTTHDFATSKDLPPPPPPPSPSQQSNDHHLLNNANQQGLSLNSNSSSCQKDNHDENLDGKENSPRIQDHNFNIDFQLNSEGPKWLAEPLKALPLAPPSSNLVHSPIPAAKMGSPQTPNSKTLLNRTKYGLNGRKTHLPALLTPPMTPLVTPVSTPVSTPEHVPISPPKFSLPATLAVPEKSKAKAKISPEGKRKYQKGKNKEKPLTKAAKGKAKVAAAVLSESMAFLSSMDDDEKEKTGDENEEERESSVVGDKRKGFLEDLTLSSKRTKITDPAKKENHNRMERQRRDELRSEFACLRKCIRTIDFEKAPKITILKEANDYISKLVATEQEQELRRLMATKDQIALKERINMLQNKLA